MNTEETPLKLIGIYFAYLSLALFSLRHILFTPGTIGYIMDHWLPYFPEQIFHRVYIVAIASQWISQSLGSIQVYSSSFYPRLIMAGLSLLGLGGGPISKGYFIFFISLSGISVYYLSRTLTLSSFPAFFAGSFYLSTPFLFNFVIAGGYSSVYSYALMPLGLAFFLKSTQGSEKSIKSPLILCLLFALLSDGIPYFVVFLVFMLGYATFDIFSRRRTEKAILYGKIFLTALVIYFLAQCAWLLPFIMKYPSLQMVTSRVEHIEAYHIPSRFIEFSPGLIKAFGLRGLCGSISDYFSFTLTNSPLWIPWILVSFTLVVLAFLPLIIKPKDKKVMYFAFMALLGLFLAKGASPPGDFINLWVFQNVPIFGPAFRDPYHIVLLVALSFAILIGITVDAILKSKKIKAHSRARRLAKPLVSACLSLLLVTYALPYLTHSLEDNLQVYNLDQNYHSLYHDFLNDEEDYKVLMLPLKEPIVPPGGTYTGSDHMLGEFGKPTLFSRMPGTSEDEKLTQFLANTLYSSSAPPTDNLGKLLGLLNVKYIVFRQDFHSYYPPYSSNKPALDTLARQQDIVFRRKYGDNIYLYENLRFLSHIYPAEKSILVVGDLSSLLYPSGKAMFFSGQQSPDSLPPLAVNKIVIQDGNYFDYVISFLPNKYTFNPVSYVSKHISDTGWINLDIFSSPVDWYQSAATESSTLTTVPDTLSIPVDTSDSGEYHVWMKVLLSPLSTSLKLDQSKLTVKSGFVPLYEESWAMPFVPKKEDLAKLSICLRKWGDPGEDLTGEIREDNGDTPKSGRTIAIFGLTNEKITEYGIWFDIGLDIRVEPGKKYWIVINRAGPDTNNTYGWAWDYEAPARSAYSSDGIEWEVRDTGSFGYQTFYSDEPLSLETAIDGYKLKKISTCNTDISRFEWVNLGLLPLSKGKHDLKITSDGGEIIVSNVLVVPQSELDKAMQEAKKYAVDKNLLFPFILNKFGDASGSLSTRGLLFYIDHTDQAHQYSAGKITNITKHLEVTTPVDGEYQFFAEAMSNSDDPELIVNYDGTATQIKLNSTEGKFRSFASEKVHLFEGSYKINLAIITHYGGSQVALRSFTVEYVAPETNNSTPSISFDKIEPTKYIVHVQTNTPFLLVFSEKCDPYWEASHNGRIFDHYKVNFFANAFWIDKTGSFDVTIQLTTPKLYQIGLTISFFTLAFLIALSIVPTRYLTRKRRLFQRC